MNGTVARECSLGDMKEEHGGGALQVESKENNQEVIQEVDVRDDSDTEQPTSPILDLSGSPRKVLNQNDHENVLRQWSQQDLIQDAKEIRSPLPAKEIVDENLLLQKENSLVQFQLPPAMDLKENVCTPSNDNCSLTEFAADSDNLGTDYQQPADGFALVERDRNSETGNSVYAELSLTVGAQVDSFDPITALLDEHWNCLRLDDPTCPTTHSCNGQPHPNESNTFAHGDSFEAEQSLDSALNLPTASDGTYSNTSSSEEISLADKETVELEALSDSFSAKARAWHLEFSEVESQLREAIRDADAVEASRERYVIDLADLQRTVDEQYVHIESLSFENESYAREITALQEGIATLQAAHEVDARMNALLIDDQAEEIRELRSKLESSQSVHKMLNVQLGTSEIVDATAFAKEPHIAEQDCSYFVPTCLTHIERERACQAKGTEQRASFVSDTSATLETVDDHTLAVSSSKSGQGLNEHEGSTEAVVSDFPQGDMNGASVHVSTTESRTRILHTHAAARSPGRNEELVALQKRKESLFKDFERKHSMSIEHVIRKTSEISIASGRTAVSQAHLL